MRSAISPLLLLLPILLSVVGCRPAAAPVATTVSSAPSPVAATPYGAGARISATPTVVPPSLQPFLEPEANYAPILSALETAKKSIRLETYLLTSSDVIDFLKTAYRKRVDVRVILEAQPVGVGAGNKPAISELTSANITVRNGNPAFKRTHGNFIVIDDRTLIVTTLEHTIDAFTVNREFGIIDSEPRDVADAIAVFDADWDGAAAPALPNSNLVVGPTDLRARLLALLDGARQTLDVETEDMQDKELEDHLIAAAQRGVAVRVVMSPAPSGPDLNQKGRETIAARGVRVRLLKTPYIHAHMIVADNARGYIGSQNFTALSLDESRELGIVTTNARIIEGLSGTFLVDWNDSR